MTDKKKPSHLFKKGQSGNPSGRPKSDKLTQKDKNQLKKLIQAKDMSGIAGFFSERSHNLSDAFKYIKEFAPYLAPKLQTVKSIGKVDKTITIKWQGEAGKIIEHVPVKKPVIEKATEVTENKE